MDLEDAEARVKGAIEAAAQAVTAVGIATPVASKERQMCEEGVMLKFKGRFQTSHSFEAKAEGPAELNGVAAAIEAAWQEDGWNVQRRQFADSPTRELKAEDDDFLLAAQHFDDKSGGFLRVTAVTPCAKPREGG